MLIPARDPAAQEVAGVFRDFYGELADQEATSFPVIEAFLESEHTAPASCHFN